MEIRHLKLVKTIVEEGSIAKAIDKLHLTQPALSHQLKEAELQVGAQLFHRVNRKLVLTEPGKKVYESALKVLSELEKTKAEIKGLMLGEVGNIVISTECYTTYHWLPSVLKRFNTLYPNVDVKINFEATHYPIQKLLEGVLDLAITSDPIPNEQIEYIDIFQDEMVGVVTENHPWATKKYVTAEDFASENLIIHSEPMETVSVWQYVLQPAKVKPRKITVLPLTEASIEMVKAELGVMVMASWALKPYLTWGNLKTVKITKNGLQRTHYIALLKNRDTPSTYRHFIEFIKQEIAL